MTATLTAEEQKKLNDDLLDLVGNHGRYSITSASVEKIEDLLNRGAQVNAVNDNGQTPLILAVRSGGIGDLDVIATLYNAGANLDKRDSEGKSALTYALTKSDAQDTVRILYDCGATVQAIDIEVGKAFPAWGKLSFLTNALAGIEPRRDLAEYCLGVAFDPDRRTAALAAMVSPEEITAAQAELPAATSTLKPAKAVEVQSPAQ